MPKTLSRLHDWLRAQLPWGAELFSVHRGRTLYTLACGGGLEPARVADVTYLFSGLRGLGGLMVNFGPLQLYLWRFKDHFPAGRQAGDDRPDPGGG